MGGQPLLALSIAAFPEELPTEMLGEILAGADEVVRSAGAILAGGHTIRDEEPKYGLAVVGTVHPAGIWPKSGARPGDALFLTKPLGTGLVLQAQRDGRAPDGALEAAVVAMRTLNRDAAEALRPFAPSAVTDVTGFGLLGHSHEMASRSGVRIELDAAAVPALPYALELAEAGVRTGGDRRNREYAGPTRRERGCGCGGRARLRSPDGRRAPRLAAHGQGGSADGHVCGQGARAVQGRPRHRRLGCGVSVNSVDVGEDGRSVVKGVRARAVSARRFLQLATVAVFTLWVVVTSGAVVRLTASGLGCDNWPRCGDKPFPERGGHAAIEFGNRIVALVGIVLTLITWLAARRVAGLPRWVRNVALVTALGTIAQIPLGGVTVLLDLHPVAVMSHFLLALLVVAGAVVVAIEAWIHASGLARPAGPPWLRAFAAVGVAACAALVVTGTVATASGPHSGGQDIRRLGLGITDTVYVHVRATAVFGIGLLVVGVFLWRLRQELPGIARAAAVLLGVLLVQMTVGEVQYRNALPWWLVVIHVSLAATIWTLTVAIAYSLHRPAAPLVSADRR